MEVLDSKYALAQKRLTRGKSVRGDRVFPQQSVPSRKRTHALSFTSEGGKMQLRFAPIKDVIGLKLSHVHLINPYIPVAPLNCCLIFHATATPLGSATTPITAGASTFFVVVELGDYDSEELRDRLNEAIAEQVGHENFRFVLNQQTNKLQIENSHATDSFYIPRKDDIDSMLAAPPLDDSIGSIWATLGFAVHDRHFEVRSVTSAVANTGLNAGLPALPANFSNKSDITFSLPFSTLDASGNVVSENVPAHYPPSSVSEISGKSLLIKDQFDLTNNLFSLAKSKKCVYLTAPGFDTQHDVVSSQSQTQLARVKQTFGAGTLVNGLRMPFAAGAEGASSVIAPVENNVNIESVLGAVPIVSGEVELSTFSSISIDLLDSRIKKLKHIDLLLVDENGKNVNLRGRTLSATIEVSTLF